MKKIHFFKSLVVLAMVIGSCSKDQSANVEETDNDGIITIHVTDRKQTIRNFGASDAWACQYIGLWPDEKRNQVADWLFSTAVDANGKPLGIGLSLWRFNIGAGSATQNNIVDEWRRAECFLKNDGTFDWTRQAGQQWFMQAAKQRGVNQFVGFTNSPPVQLTKNGKGFSGNGETANISKSNYVAFASFLSGVVKHFQEQGITLNYLSPFNEPQWDWINNNQEGSPYTNQEIYEVVKKLDSVITTDNLPSKIQVAEAGKMNYLYALADKSTRGDQIDDFFTPGSPHYMGDFPSVDKMISAHSYFTTAPTDTMINVRRNLNRKIQSASVPLEFWQSEYCILGDQEEVPGNGKDISITTALYVARIIHYDLTVANAAVWHWWTALSVYDYKDGLVYADKNKTTGAVEDAKLLWALGNYSRFVRPGAVRVGVSATKINIDNPKGLMFSSYVHEADNKLVAVVINYGNTDSAIKIAVEGDTINSFKPYLTAAKDDEELKPLAEIKSGESIVIPKRSIMTLVSDLH